ncbi:AAA family ATPase [Flagellimonas amoyensis]|uniref:AAA family ATPase n=1 Tax=Flagellimonas amoyensis TaxID=2169401 RepID=UPI000D37C0DB|nr:ATP-binding protein [Allomuricauda amoyensis]
MLIEFSVGNYRSIKDVQTISFVPTGLKSPEKYDSIDKNNIARLHGYQTFKTVGIYGANGSGKSNLVKALDNFIKVVTQEASSSSNMEALCDPFLYQDDSEYSECYFQIVLVIDEKKYRYGLTAKRNPKQKEEGDSSWSKEIVTNEWLFGTKEKNMAELFIRTGADIKKDRLPNNESIPPTVAYEHTLFLTHAAAFDSEGVSQKIRNYLGHWTISNLNSEHERFRKMSVNMITSRGKKDEFLDMLSSFDLRYSDVEIEDEEEIKNSKLIPQNIINLSREYSPLEGNNRSVFLNLQYNESVGTQKLFDLAGLLLITFNLSKPAFVTLDEIDSNFHPSLLIKLIKMFNDPSINKSQSQLLFTSHDTNLMSPSIMRRDQFYFAEKNEDQSTRLYSLADLRGIRNDADFAKQYLAGFYGALPILNDFVES